MSSKTQLDLKAIIRYTLIFVLYWNTLGRPRAGLPKSVVVGLGAIGSWPNCISVLVRSIGWAPVATAHLKTILLQEPCSELTAKIYMFNGVASQWNLKIKFYFLSMAFIVYYISKWTQRPQLNILWRYFSRKPAKQTLNYATKFRLK